MSANPQDIIGHVVGRLTVLRRAIASNDIRYVVRCTCGEIKVIRKSQILSGDTKSCGCLQREITAAHRARRAAAGLEVKKRRSRIGERHGRLTIVGPWSGTARIERYMCQCECGTLKAIDRRNLYANGIKSCGCLRREWASEMQDRLATQRWQAAARAKEASSCQPSS